MLCFLACGSLVIKISFLQPCILLELLFNTWSRVLVTYWVLCNFRAVFNSFEMAFDPRDVYLKAHHYPGDLILFFCFYETRLYTVAQASLQLKAVFLFSLLSARVTVMAAMHSFHPMTWDATFTVDVCPMNLDPFLDCDKILLCCGIW